MRAFCSSVYIYLTWVCLFLQSCARECRIEGLETEDVNIKGDAYFLRLDSTREITLTCNCTLYEPQWEVYEQESHSFHTPANGKVHCGIKNGTTCTRTYIDEDLQAEGYFVYKTVTLKVSRTLFAMCFSSFQRETLFLTTKENDPPSVVLPLLSSTTFSSNHLLSHSTINTVQINKSKFLSFSHDISTVMELETISTSKTYSVLSSVFTSTIGPQITTVTPRTENIFETVSTSTIMLAPFILVVLVISFTSCTCSVLCFKRSLNRNMKELETFIESLKDQRAQSGLNDLNRANLFAENSQTGLTCNHSPKHMTFSSSPILTVRNSTTLASTTTNATSLV